MRALADSRVIHGPVLSTFIAYAVPSLIGLVAISTASIVDGMFVSRFVGPDALAAVNLLVPYFTLLFGIALMLAMGGSVSAGRHLGAGDPAAASAMFSKSVLAVVATSSVAAMLGNAYDEGLYRALGAPAELFSLMRSYFRVISVALVIQLGTLVVYYFVRLDGRPVLATSALVAGAVTHIALNALFVAHWQWGLRGAAYASALSQLLQLAVLLSHFWHGKSQLHFRLAQRGWSELARSAFNGASELVNEVSVGVVALVLNWMTMSRVGVDGVAAFTVVNYAIFASLMFYYGAADALHLLVSQNLGAGNPLRARAFLRCALACVSAVGLLLACSLLVVGDHWIALFLEGAAPAVLSQASAFLRLIWPVLLVNGANVVFTVYLAALQRPLPAGLLAVARSLLLPAGFLVLLTRFMPEQPFVLAFPLAEGITFALGVWLLLRRQTLPSGAPGSASPEQQVAAS